MAPKSVIFTKILKRYLLLALSRWPAVSPTTGRNVLPKRAEPQESSETPMSVLADSLGPLRRGPPTLVPPPTLPEEVGAPFSNFQGQGPGAQDHLYAVESHILVPPSGAAGPQTASTAACCREAPPQAFHSDSSPPPPAPLEGPPTSSTTNIVEHDWAQSARSRGR